jgi:hypothetical protein
MAAPRPGCRRGKRGGKLTLENPSGARNDRLLWHWSATGPVAADAFARSIAAGGSDLCLYDESTPTPRTAFRAALHGDMTCAGNAAGPCWLVPLGIRFDSAGFRYRSLSHAPDGVGSAWRRAAKHGDAAITVKGRGARCCGCPPGRSACRSARNCKAPMARAGSRRTRTAASCTTVAAAFSARAHRDLTAAPRSYSATRWHLS